MISELLFAYSNKNRYLSRILKQDQVTIYDNADKSFTSDLFDLSHRIYWPKGIFSSYKIYFYNSLVSDDTALDFQELLYCEIRFNLSEYCALFSFTVNPAPFVHKISCLPKRL